jgi:hypothetical protein
MQTSRVQQQASSNIVPLSAVQSGANAASTGAPNVQSRAGEAPQAFFDAARNGDIGALATMLATRQASAAAVEAKSGMTALMLAVLRGHAGVVSLLAERRDAAGFINARDARGNTALYLARAAGYDDIAALLEEAGAQEGAALTTAVSLAAVDVGKGATLGAANGGAQRAADGGAAGGMTSAPTSTAATDGIVSSTQIVSPAPAQKPRPTTVLQAAEEGNAAALRMMLAEMKAAGKDVEREVNRYGDSAKLLYRGNDFNERHFRRRGCECHGRTGKDNVDDRCQRQSHQDRVPAAGSRSRQHEKRRRRDTAYELALKRGFHEIAVLLQDHM